ncbi:MAG: hypothetical protein KAQ98_03340, partial [Bacteriovoracaceae bacterium]|nr:hypothetical protein [Bacteriovoracaceae bacterium]
MRKYLFFLIAIVFFGYLSIFITMDGYTPSKTDRAPADSGNITLSENFSITQTQLKELEQKFEKFAEEKYMHHWTSISNGIRWTLQGNFGKGEMDFLNTPTGRKQVYGSGFYLAEDPRSSRNFGDFPVAVKLKKGTPIYDENIAEKILGKSLSENEITELGKHLPFVRNVTDDWWLTHHPENSSELVYAAIINPETTFKTKNLPSLRHFYEQLWNGVRENPDGKYLNSLIGLSTYMDGISYIRALKVNPGNPWAEFEPEHFEKFKNTQEYFTYNIIEAHKIYKGLDSYGEMEEKDRMKLYWKKKPRITDNKKFSDEKFSREEWIKHQKENIIPEIYRRISGNLEGFVYRNEGVSAAGGSRQNGTFLASTAQTAVLKNNNYLEVHAKSHPSGDGFLVKYFYPDALHYKQLKGIISDKLYETLEKTDPDELLEKKHDLRKKLNSQIIDELLDDVLDRYYNTSVDFKKDKSMELAKDLISIHPFENFNGRTIRFWINLAHMEQGTAGPWSFLNDFDLLLSPIMQKKIATKGNEFHNKLRNRLLSELLISKGTRGPPPAYHDIDMLEDLFKSLEPLGFDPEKKITWDNSWNHLIRDRKFTELFDEIIGKSWRYADMESVLLVFSTFEDKKFLNNYLGKITKFGFFERINKDIIDEFISNNINSIDDTWYKGLGILYKNVDHKLKKIISSRTRDILVNNPHWSSKNLIELVFDISGHIDPLDRVFHEFLTTIATTPNLIKRKDDLLTGIYDSFLEKSGYGNYDIEDCLGIAKNRILLSETPTQTMQEILEKAFKLQQKEESKDRMAFISRISSSHLDIVLDNDDELGQFLKLIASDERILGHIDTKKSKWDKFITKNSVSLANEKIMNELRPILYMKFLEQNFFGYNDMNLCLEIAIRYIRENKTKNLFDNFKYI